MDCQMKSTRRLSNWTHGTTNQTWSIHVNVKRSRQMATCTAGKVKVINTIFEVFAKSICLLLMCRPGRVTSRSDLLFIKTVFNIF